MAHRYVRIQLAHTPLRAYVEDVQLRFGEFTLDTDRRQLRRDGVDRHLSLQGVELLHLLIDNHPRALSKREIHERLWPDVSFSEAALTSLAAEVRRALDETAMREDFLRTVPRFGYAFHGEANEVNPPTPPRATPRVRCWLVLPSGQLGLPDGEYMLGRNDDVAVAFDSLTVSRHHARIRVSHDVAVVEDLHSRNGTFLNGERLTAPAPLADGDEIALGLITVRFSVTEPGGATRSLREPNESVRR